jgi:glucan phosphoethanolaminetransferase (alkaline phosphatase superfamily)
LQINSNLKKISDDTNLIYVSDFPHGYSLSQGRLLYYYGKHICYSIPSNAFVDSITLNISKDPETNFSIFNNLSNEYDENLKSIILDVFDFDMKWL